MPKWNSFVTLSQKDAEINVLLGTLITSRQATSEFSNATLKSEYARACTANRCQSPGPGLGEKYFSYFPATPSISFASGKGSRFTVIFGQIFAYSVLI